MMTQQAERTAVDVVSAYHRAWTSGDVDAAMHLVADDVVCQVPGEETAGKDGWRAYLQGFVPMLTGVSDLTSLSDDDQVALLYSPHTAVTSTAYAAEHFRVRDGLIASIVLVFDRLSYAPPAAEKAGES
jgi:ketosteroid isomerase-like protein